MFFYITKSHVQMKILCLEKIKFLQETHQQILARLYLFVVVSSMTSRRYYNSTDNQFGSRNLWKMLVSGGHCFHSYIPYPQNLNHPKCLKGRMRTYITSLIEVLD